MLFRFIPHYVALVLTFWNSLAAAELPKIGFLLPLSGNFANLGEDVRQGVEAALEVQGQAAPFRVVYADSKADPSTSVSEFRKLIQADKIAAAFVIRSPVGMALNPVSRRSKIPLVGAVGANAFAVSNEYAFQAWTKSSQEGGFLASVLSDKGFTRIAVVTAEDDWTGDVSEGFRGQLKASSVTPLFDELVLPTDTDFRGVILRLRSKSPDVIVANLALAQIGPFLRQLREHKISTPVYSNFWVAKKDVVESASTDIVEGVRFVEMDTDLPTLRRVVQARHQSTPSAATLSAYMGTLLMLQAASNSESLRTPQGFHLELLKQVELRTPDGVFEVRDRCIQFSLVEKVMRDGKAVLAQDR